VRDRGVLAVFAIGLAVAAVAGGWYLTAGLSAEEPPDASFEVTGDVAAGELVVEHAGGDPIASGALRILVYEDRPIVPDRTVHGTIWETNRGPVAPGDRIELEDPRFESGQRVVVRWFGDDGQANLYETRI
jgi:hypothetical protein